MAVATPKMWKNDQSIVVSKIFISFFSTFFFYLRNAMVSKNVDILSVKNTYSTSPIILLPSDEIFVGMEV